MGREDQGLAQSRGRYRVIPRSLCFITHNDAVLLLRGGPHKRLWAGRYNGIGGHVERGEDVYTAAAREIREETGLQVHNLQLRGVVHVDAGDPTTGILVFVFTAVAVNRQVVPSAEGALEWWSVGDLPVADMVEDLPVLLPKVLAMAPTDPPFAAFYGYDAEDRLVISFVPPFTGGE
jgi:8-oxo-dGTP diphosphatase